MYEKHYKLNEKPFTVTPDSRFFYPSGKHNEALSVLMYTVLERRGFTVFTGDVGAGKTTVVRKLFSQLDAATKTALISNSNMTPKQLIYLILQDLGINCNDRNTKAFLLNRLNEYLLEQLSLDCNVVLIIDEAQNLHPRVLEELRMLSNLETDSEKLLQIILVGQPELLEKLDMFELRQLKQRVNLFVQLTPFNRQEADEYINHRLKLAGANGQILFDQGCLDRVYHYSQGVPRLINSICDRSLLTGFIYSHDSITPEIIDEVSTELRIKNKEENDGQDNRRIEQISARA